MLTVQLSLVYQASPYPISIPPTPIEFVQIGRISQRACDLSCDYSECLTGAGDEMSQKRLIWCSLNLYTIEVFLALSAHVEPARVCISICIVRCSDDKGLFCRNIRPGASTASVCHFSQELGGERGLRI
jgi:hypothetical protein